MENIDGIGISTSENTDDTQIDSKGIEDLQKLEQLKASYLKLDKVVHGLDVNDPNFNDNSAEKLGDTHKDMRNQIQELEKKLFGIEKEDGFFKINGQTSTSNEENKKSLLSKVRGMLRI
ncbi:MAG: hypothetical protein WAV11_01505 [Minisyncoccia bacterium]